MLKKKLRCPAFSRVCFWPPFCQWFLSYLMKEEQVYFYPLHLHYEVDSKETCHESVMDSRRDRAERWDRKHLFSPAWRQVMDEFSAKERRRCMRGGWEAFCAWNLRQAIVHHPCDSLLSQENPFLPALCTSMNSSICDVGFFGLGLFCFFLIQRLLE